MTHTRPPKISFSIIEEAKISKEDSLLFDSYVRLQATNEITREYARLLITCMGNTLSGMQKGVCDLQGVSMSNELRAYFPPMHNRLCPPFSLRSFPEAALARIFSLRMNSTDNFLLDFFRLVAAKDVSFSVRGSKTVSMLGAPVEVMQANKDLWCEVKTMGALDHVIRGLADVVQMIINPSILNQAEIRAFGAILHQKWETTSVFLDEDQAYEKLKGRLVKHTVAVRSRVESGTGTIEPFTELGEQTKLTMIQAMEAANQKKISLSTLVMAVEGRKETVSGAFQRFSKGVNDNRETKWYKCQKNNQVYAAILGIQINMPFKPTHGKDSKNLQYLNF